jgi:class 3 adenylate cyclase
VLPGGDMDVLLPGDAVALGLIDGFLAQAHVSAVNPPALTTVLLADIPEALQLTEALGRDLRERREAILSEVLQRFQGHAVTTRAAALAASFDGPTRALRFAQALRQALHDQLSLEIRIGLHSGECRQADGVLAGAAVDVGTGVLRAARAGEVLVSAEVRDLATGCGIAFHSVGRRSATDDAAARELFAVEG